MNDLLRVPQIAESLNYSKSSVYALIKRGLLPAVRLPGGSMRVRRIDLEKFIDELADAEAEQAE